MIFLYVMQTWKHMHCNNGIQIIQCKGLIMSTFIGFYWNRESKGLFEFSFRAVNCETHYLYYVEKNLLIRKCQRQTCLKKSWKVFMLHKFWFWPRKKWKEKSSSENWNFFLGKMQRLREENALHFLGSHKADMASQNFPP